MLQCPYHWQKATPARREKGHAVQVNQKFPMAQELGVPVAQAVRHLDQAGIARNHRSRIVGTPKETKLMQMLKVGSERKEISAALGVRKALIKDYLATDETLRATWQRQRR